MNYKQILTILSFLLLSIQIFGQSDVIDLVKEGIQYHDNGDYKKAILTYKKALKIDSKSTLVNYEIALSYFSKGDYKKAIKYSDKVLDENADYLLEAYMTKGSALDLMGKSQKSIEVFETAIDKLEGHFLIHYNLALNYFKIEDYLNAEINAIRAIELNSNHSSSHLMLAKIHNAKQNSVQAILAFHYFLFLEPNTNRSDEAFGLLQNNFGGSVSKDQDDSNSILISLSEPEDSPFVAAELMISMLEASKYLEENEGKSEVEMFLENTETFFTTLGALQEDQQDIWFAFYIPFFNELSKSGHIETYCRYITQSEHEDSQKWLKENEAKLVEFDNWLQGK